MKLLFAIKSVNGIGGGAERVLTQVTSGLVGRGYRVALLTFDPPGTSFYPLASGVERFDMACCEPGRSLKLSHFLSSVPEIRRVVRLWKADLVIPFMHSTYVPLVFALCGLRVNLVASEHTEAKHFENRPFQRVLRKVAVKRCVSVTVPSESARQSFVQTDNLDSVVVPNPIDLASFGASISASSDATPTILSLGNLRPEKGHSTLISAFAEIASEFPNWRLRIVGEGELREALEEQCIQLGLDERIELVGFSSNVAVEFARARFIVLPSRYESFGLAAVEALASGRPVLAFDDCAGICEVVTHGVDGLLVPGGPDHTTRANQLVIGLRELMSDADLVSRLGAAGPAAVERFDLPSVLDRWEEVIELAFACARGGKQVDPKR